MTDDTREQIDAEEVDAVEVASHEEGQSDIHTMMDRHFLEYASYVIKDRAIPDIDDGLKPVQRRILHSLNRMDDGKFHKVANVIGHTMQFHPHGDSSIGSALVNLANKNFLIDRQGNFGNIMTGDVASAARYIECRLTPLAREVLFNKELTEFTESYDGRNQEPITLPCKVPLLLMQGAEGIAVGMATKIMPHNFCELLNAQISIIKGEPFQLYPDFQQGAIMDASDYQDGNGKLKLRAKIEKSKESTKALVIREIPPTTTTESVIHSIEEASRKNKIKISAIHDYTAENVEIEVILQRGVNVDKAIMALYAYTDCEVSISPNLMLIKNNRPVQMSVTDVLKHNTEKLVELLKRELEIELGKLEDQFHAKTLEQIFIEQRVYKLIEECTSYEDVIEAVDTGLKPFRHLLKRDVLHQDIEKLLEIRIKRISRFDINKSRREIEDIIARIDEVVGNLCNLRKYTIDFIKALLKKYGESYPRRTLMERFEQVDVRKVALRNLKVGYDRSSGMLGTAVKSEETLTCTEYDRLVLFSKKDGVAKIIPVQDKIYIGKGVEVFKADKKQIYSMIYRDKKNDTVYAKRFRVSKYIMDKEYNAIPVGCRIDRIYTNAGVVVRCDFEPAKRQQVTFCDIVFDDMAMRSFTARGFKVTDKKVKKYNLLERDNEVAVVEEVTDKGGAKEAATEPEEEQVAVAPKLNRELNRIFSDSRATYSDRSFSEKVIDFSDDYSSFADFTEPVAATPEKIDSIPVKREDVEEVSEAAGKSQEPQPPLETEEVADHVEKAKTAPPVAEMKQESVVEDTPVAEAKIEAESTEDSAEPVATEPEQAHSTKKTKKRTGYREIPIEERAKRFRIDEDTPFSLEMD